MHCCDVALYFYKMNEERFKALFERYLDNTISGDDLLEFQEAVQDQQYNELLDELLKSAYKKPEYAEDDSEAKQAVFANVMAEIHGKHENRIVSFKRKTVAWKWLAGVAASLIIVAGGVLYLKHHNNSNPNKNYASDVAPGNKNAILKMGSGKSIILSNATTGTIAQVGNMTISKGDSSAIVYNGTQALSAGKVVYDTIINPAGSKIYHLNLADGTKILVNAATTLCFPENFAAKRNMRILKGEAFFRVAYNAARPFTTSVKDQTIADLGTQFNISAYDDESYTVTTLVEGSISITKSKTTKTLVPGQQAKVLLDGANVEVKNVDTEDAIAWTTGNFMFDGDNLGEVMKKLSRWYDVDVVYDDPSQANQVIGGGITMFTNVSKVLDALQKASNVHFKINGRKITVMK